MKTKYQELYEYLTPMIIMGKLTTQESAHILSVVKMLEMRVDVLERMTHDLYAESKRDDLAQDIQGEGAESFNEIENVDEGYEE